MTERRVKQEMHGSDRRKTPYIYSSSQGIVLDKGLHDYLAGVVGVVEATSYEEHMLWDENRRRERPLTWHQNSHGRLETVGRLVDMPVCVSLFTVDVGGHRVLFIHPTSQVVDHRMIDDWLVKYIPQSGRRPNDTVNRTDAMNFHNVFPRTDND